MKAIEFTDVSFRYLTADQPAISHVSFTVEQGKLCGIIGPNGAGKTTLCNLIRGFAPAFYPGEFSGNIHVGSFEEEQIVENSSKEIGYVFQNPFVQMSGARETVFEEIAFGLENLGFATEQIKQRVDEVMRLLKIEALKKRHPQELSGGQKQRVAFAAILAMDPAIYVIDEPTSQLDPQGTKEVFEIIELLKKQKKTIILVEHKLELLADIADQLLVLEAGELVMDDNVRQVLTNQQLQEREIIFPKYTRLGCRLKNKFKQSSALPINKKECLALSKSCLTSDTFD